MKPLTLESLRKLTSGDYQPVVFLDIHPANEPALHLTDAPQAITLNGCVYHPAEVQHDFRDGRNVIAIVMRGVVGVNWNGARATLRVCDKSLTNRARNALVLTTGKIADHRLVGRQMTFKILNVLAQMQRQTNG
jgi:hypothetical protein